MRKHFFLQVILLLSLFSLELTAQKPVNVSAWPRGITYEIFVLAFADSDGDGGTPDVK